MNTNFGKDTWKGLNSIIKLNENETVRLKVGKVTDSVNMRNINPF